VTVLAGLEADPLALGLASTVTPFESRICSPQPQ
jgi:hypothetical protein